MRINRSLSFAGMALLFQFLISCGGGGGGGSATTPQIQTPTFSVGVQISGLAAGQTVQLTNNNVDRLSITANGSFKFPTQIVLNGSYAVVVENQPNGQVCTVNQGTGSNVTASIGPVQVVCSTDSFNITVTMNGLPAGAQLTAFNNGTDAQVITANGTFTFPAPIAYGGNYLVTIGSIPAGQNCSVISGSGTAYANVVNVSILCSQTTYTLGGTLTGLALGLQVTLINNMNNNGMVPQTFSSNGPFTFTGVWGYNDSYSVTVGTQPIGQFCTVANGSGTGISGNVSNVNVSCTSAAVALSACAEIASSGNFSVTQNVAAPPNYRAGTTTSTSCIYIHDTSNVKLDCGNNTIIGDAPITISNVQTFSVTNCHFQSVGTQGGISILDSDGGIFSNNSYSGPPIAATFTNVNNTNNLVFSNNTIMGVYQQGNSSNNIISNNIITGIPVLNNAALVETLAGVNNQISGNTLNGGWDRNYINGIPSAVGASDGIMVGNEIGDTIQNNNIFNTAQDGIDIWGMLANSSITGNNISYAANTGIAGFEYISMLGNIISNNTVTQAGNLFSFQREYGLIPAPTAALTQLGAGTAVIFSNNQFINNQLVSSNTNHTFNSVAAFLPVFDYLGYLFGGNLGPGGVEPTTSQFQFSNNTFTNNSFGHTVPGPYFGTNPVVPGMIIDGGGNVCLTPTGVASYPLVCN